MRFKHVTMIVVVLLVINSIEGMRPRSRRSRHHRSRAAVDNYDSASSSSEESSSSSSSESVESSRERDHHRGGHRRRQRRDRTSRELQSTSDNTKPREMKPHKHESARTKMQEIKKDDKIENNPSPTVNNTTEDGYNITDNLIDIDGNTTTDSGNTTTINELNDLFLYPISSGFYKKKPLAFKHGVVYFEIGPEYSFDKRPDPDEVKLHLYNPKKKHSKKFNPRILDLHYESRGDTLNTTVNLKPKPYSFEKRRPKTTAVTSTTAKPEAGRKDMSQMKINRVHLR